MNVNIKKKKKKKNDKVNTVANEENDRKGLGNCIDSARR